MNQPEHDMLKKLELATARDVPPEQLTDPELRQLHEGWLVLCRALDAAQATAPLFPAAISGCAGPGLSADSDANSRTDRLSALAPATRTNDGDKGLVSSAVSSIPSRTHPSQPRTRRRPWLWTTLTGGVALVALILLIATWDDGQQNATSPAGSSTSGAVAGGGPGATSPVGTPSRSQSELRPAPEFTGSDHSLFVWEDTFDQQLASAAQQLWSVRSDSASPSDTRYSEILYQLQDLDQELKGGSL